MQSQEDRFTVELESELPRILMSILDKRARGTVHFDVKSPMVPGADALWALSSASDLPVIRQVARMTKSARLFGSDPTGLRLRLERYRTPSKCNRSWTLLICRPRSPAECRVRHR